ncbi:MAG: DUF1566 domain-containing protein [Sulfurospirillum cavolei]|nr:DUF1566 domain-containing protein [Sulfurospirillum cavolei]
MRKVVLGLGLLVASVLYADVVSQNGIAKDNVTGLIWQDEPYTSEEYRAYDNDLNYGKAGNWEYAKQYCKELRLGGFSDWRLPNIYELVTLLDNTKSKAPHVINGLHNVTSERYWSSNTVASKKSNAWYVYFYDGKVIWDDKGYSSSVRCVRSGQVNFETLSSLKKNGVLKVAQEWIDKINPK